ncbi:MAG: HisA/HisF-related TIM barrel protein [Rhizobiaceae bacterium]|nr:HisA/HisF-related TIM barrel protein [Rhizobiaceae bacterium]
MRIIPVLDLKGGLVVRAHQGRRDEYRPIETPLSASADPVAVAEGLRGLYPFATFYCADLDAIEGRAPNAVAVERLSGMDHPPAIWLDAGFGDADTLQRALANPQVHPVMGTESQRDGRLLRSFTAEPRLVLSLDFFPDGYRGPPELLDRADLWPQTIIVMTLARVGAGGGPDFALLGTIKERAQGRTVVAAGGVSGVRDVEELHALGIDAVLMATALHGGRFTSSQLDSLQR